jgi:hypothetical protein
VVSRRKRDFLGRRREGYYEATHRPLNCLFFLLPLIVWIQIGTLWIDWGSPSTSPERVRAFYWILKFLWLFGDAPRYLPGLLLVALFLTWHQLQTPRDRLRWPVVGGMAFESIILMLPLLILNHLFNFYVLAAADRDGMSLGSELIVALTAGVYEELIFRLLLIWLLKLLLIDLLEWDKGAATVLIVTAAGLMFAGYHFIGPSTPWDFRRFFFLAVAGLYLGVVYVHRGFGIAVGVHALYDVVLVSL